MNEKEEGVGWLATDLALQPLSLALGSQRPRPFVHDASKKGFNKLCFTKCLNNVFTGNFVLAQYPAQYRALHLVVQKQPTLSLLT